MNDPTSDQSEVPIGSFLAARTAACCPHKQDMRSYAATSTLELLSAVLCSQRTRPDAKTSGREPCGNPETLRVPSKLQNTPETRITPGRDLHDGASLI